jgi:hypothetical protein
VGVLERVLLAADLLEPDELAGAHEHLARDCKWYAHVDGGGSDGPEKHCKPGTVKLTPRTPEASTVPKPTRPPGGPGLFHIKGRELPPYIQHLWHHLKDEYGPEKAYKVAVGVVKKWAKGIHPGGKHPGRVHADVRAAAQKNIAEWEKDRADAHRQSAGRQHVRASAAMPRETLESVHGPYTAGNPWDIEAGLAHEVEEIGANLTHARLHAAALGRKQDEKSRQFNCDHADRHLDSALLHTRNFLETLRRHYPRETAALDDLVKTRRAMGVALARDANHVATTPHLADTVAENLAHAKAHLAACREAKDPAGQKFNLWHVMRHIDVTAEHVAKLARHVAERYPRAGAALRNLAGLRKSAGLTGPVALARIAESAPGAQPVTNPPGLRTVAAPTVSPSPPLPPRAQPPSAAEVRKLAGQVPDCTDASLSQSARNHLEAAAAKLAKNDVLAALHVLRAAQSDVYAAHKADLGAAGPAYYTANVFSRAVPPGELSSANKVMVASQQKQAAWRALEQHIAACVDRIRRNFFHGQLNSMVSQARFSRESPLGRVVRLSR